MPLLQRIINARHFAELQAEERICPRGEQRADLRAAWIAMQLVAHLAQHRGTIKLSDFIYEPDDLLAVDDRAEAEAEGEHEEAEPAGAIPPGAQRIMNTMNQLMHVQNARNAELRRRQGKS